MMEQKSNRARENFLQRRYGVRLGRRYTLAAAASVVLVGMLSYSQVNSSNATAAVARSPLPTTESPAPDQA